MDRSRWLIPASWIVAALAFCFALWFTVHRAWVCDDAFISFRYCRNLVDGLGLVYNAGERVEGYTNFLWVMLLVPGMALGGDPVVLGQVLGVGFLIGTIGVLAWTARQMGTIPLAAIGLSLHVHMLLFATCGLETSMFCFLVTLGLVLLARSDRPVQFGWGGTCLILATMTRPDGALFFALASLVVVAVAWRRRRVAVLGAYAVPFVLLYVPYFIWKFSYYGHPFPNTYYAKLASKPYIGQGFYYVRLYLVCYWYLLPALVVPSVLVLRSLRRGQRGRDDVSVPGIGGRRGLILVTLFTLPYLGYVIWVGGDFMFSRFCLPVTPALLIGLQYLVRSRRSLVVAAVCAFVLAGSYFTAYPRADLQLGQPGHVVEEPRSYPAWYVECYRILGEKLRDVFAGGKVRVAIGGAQAMLAYYGEFAYVLELNGLTDEHIAHRQIEKRGMVGHEKCLPLEDEYIRARGVDIIVGPLQFHRLAADPLAAQRQFEFLVKDAPFEGERHTAFARATLLRYDAKLLAPLVGREDVRFQPFPAFLDDYIAKMAGLKPARIRRDLAAFDAFYFAPNQLMESAVRRRILDRLGK